MRNVHKIIASVVIVSIGISGTVFGQAVVPGDIIITEFMADPDSTLDGEGEYVELYNKRSVSINIDGFILKDDGTDSHTIDNSGTLTIPAESFIVLARSADPGFTEDYVYSSFSLVNSGDQIVLTDSDGTEIARVDYSSSTSGKSSELDALSSVNDDGEASDASYSESGSAIGNGDSGSPGSAGSTNLNENPTVRFSESGATVSESDGTITIEVVLEDPDGNSVDVDVAFQQNISTAEGPDFTTSTTQTVSFDSEANDGATQNASFTLVSDSDYEGNEKAEFILTNISTSGATTISGQTEFALTIEDDDTPNVVINEFLADPGGIDIDGNGSTNGTSDDEFIEIVNNESISVDISGWEVSDNGTDIKYTFSEGAILPANAAIVVFSNDTDAGEPVGTFGGALVFNSDNVLSLNNSGDTPTLLDAEGNTIDSHTFSSSTSGVSAVRDPEGTGSFKDHNEVTGHVGNYSPGTKTDSTLFTTSIVIEGNAGWRMLSAPVENMPISEITDDTPIQGFGDGHQKNFYDGYNGTSFTAPGDLNGNLTSGEGFILYFYNNTDASSSTLPVVIDVGSNSEPSSDVNVSLHSEGNGWNLLGNPYQTAFDVSSISPTSGSLASAVGQIWSDEDESYILTSANDDKVAPGQGFFLQNTNAPSVDLPTSGKTTGTRFYKEVHQKAFVQLALITEGVNGVGTQKDLSTMLYFHEEADLGLDQWDAEKIYPLKASYSLLNILDEETGMVKAQDSRVFENLGNEVFQLNVEAMNVKSNQVLEWNRSSNIPDEWTFTFTDHETGEEIIMDESFSYLFNQDEISLSSKKPASKLSKRLSVSRNSDETPRFTITLNKGNTTNIDEGSQVPEQFALGQNYPNPFNPTTSIQYSVAEAGGVSLTVYNVMGQRVETLVNGTKAAGTYRVSWDAAKMASGIYYYRLQAAGQVLTRQMTLIK